MQMIWNAQADTIFSSASIAPQLSGGLRLGLTGKTNQERKKEGKDSFSRTNWIDRLLKWVRLYVFFSRNHLLLKFFLISVNLWLRPRPPQLTTKVDCHLLAVNVSLLSDKSALHTAHILTWLFWPPHAAAVLNLQSHLSLFSFSLLIA